MTHSPLTAPRRHVWPFAAAVAVLLVAVGVAIGLLLRSPDEPTVQPGAWLSDLAASQAALPACKDLFQVGKPVGDPEGGCRGLDGTVHFVGARPCGDGRRLVNVDRVTGVQTGWGFVGDTYHSVTGEVAADPAFGSAYDACVG